jgi:hypothetical protein
VTEVARGGIKGRGGAMDQGRRDPSKRSRAAVTGFCGVLWRRDCRRAGVALRDGVTPLAAR